LEVAQTDLAIQNLEQQAETEVRLAWVDLKRARNQIEAGKVTLRLREATLQAERDRFEVGDATSLDVAQAQRDLLESRLNLLRARIAIRSAWIDLHTASGKYLSSRGIEILP
jgi:outer membrane protein TolC